MSERLPRGWVAESAAVLCESIPNGSTPSADRMGTSGDIPFLKVYNLTFDGRLDFTKNPTFVSRDTHERILTRSRAVPGDVLMNIVGPPLGKVSIVPADYPEWNFNQAIVAFRPRRGALDTHFLKNFLVHESARWAQRFSKATVGQHNIAVSDCRAMSIPVPPINEQRRIVAKLEDLLARSRRAKDALEAVPPLLEKLRQSILAAAFRGDLTADWRAKNPDVEPAEELLKRIRVERRKKWEEAELAKLRAKGKAPADDRWKAKYQEPEPVDTDGLPELPEGWCWANLESCSHDMTVGHVGSMQKEYVPDGVPFLRSQNVRPNRFESRELRYISTEFHCQLQKSSLSPGDLVIVRTGEPGVACVIPPSLPSANCSDLVIVRLIDLALPHFVSFYMNSSSARAHVASEQVGVAQQHFNVGAARLLPIPTPPIAEQVRIADLLSAAEGSLRSLRSKLTLEQVRSRSLDAALLAKAFRGELVEQDPNDEPASVMLERLAAERATDSSAPKKGEATKATSGKGKRRAG